MRAGQCAPWPTGEAYQNCLQAHASEITARVNSTTHFFAVAEENKKLGRDNSSDRGANSSKSPRGRMERQTILRLLEGFALARECPVLARTETLATGCIRPATVAQSSLRGHG